MNIYINRIVEKITGTGISGERFKIKNLKTISGNIHAVIVNINDENSEFTVALSVLEDKNRFRLIEKYEEP